MGMLPMGRVLQPLAQAPQQELSWMCFQGNRQAACTGCLRKAGTSVVGTPQSWALVAAWLRLVSSQLGLQTCPSSHRPLHALAAQLQHPNHLSKGLQHGGAPSPIGASREGDHTVPQEKP